MAALEKIIREEIESRGPMRFERFMELALYHPQYGYYSRPGERLATGRHGDFFTSVSVGPLFGRLLAAQCFQMWEQLGKPRPFWIVEQGANDGRLAEDIMSWAGEGGGDFFAALCYGIVEPLQEARAIQRQRFTASRLVEKIEWFENLADLSLRKINGVFFSNELVDSFPARVVRRKEGNWSERFIGWSESGWLEDDRPIEDPEMMQATEQLPKIEDYTTEINLRARRWMGEVARAMECGYVITIDYGFTASLYYEPFRSTGTLTGYRDHRRVENILEDVGNQDITAHVDFTALIRAGEANQLKTLGLVDQQHFLMGIAESELAGDAKKRLGLANDLRAWNTLTHPAHLGSRFLVLVQAKNAPHHLDGLRFSKAGGWD